MRRSKALIVVLILTLVTAITLPISYVSADPVKIDNGIFLFQEGDCAPEAMTCFDEERTRELSEATTEANLCMEELEDCEPPALVRVKILTAGGIGLVLGAVLGLLAN